MRPRKELALGITSLGFAVAGVTGAINSASEAGNVDAQMKQNPAYVYSLTLDSARNRLLSVESDLTYSHGTIKIGDISVPYTNYPNGIEAWSDINTAVSELKGEPEIVREIFSASDSIPKKAEITVYDNKPADIESFSKEKAKLEAIRAEIATISQANKAEVAPLQKQKDDANFRFLLSMLATGMGMTGGMVFGLNRMLDDFSN